MTPNEAILKFPQIKGDSINDNVLVDMICPNCGARGTFRITATVTATVFDDGVEETEDTAWDDSSACTCSGCGHDGTVGEFTIPGLDDELSTHEN